MSKGTVYKDQKRREKNKVKKVLKHLKRHVNDTNARDFVEKLQGEIK